MWRKFYKAYGADAMRDAYWWESSAEARMGACEHVWSFTDLVVHAPEDNGDGLSMAVRTTREVVGWGSTQLGLADQDDDEAVMTAGVFPDFQRQGYRVAILDYMCKWAAEQGANYAVTNTNKSNTEQYARKIREAESGPWTFAGERWYPAPGYGIFVRDLKPDEDTADDVPNVGSDVPR